MKHLKNFYKVIVLVMVLAITSPVVISNMKEITTYAATIKLNKTSLSLNIGKTYTLKVQGTKSKVTWSSSNKAVATVSTSGKVTAKKEGKATITAKVNKKKFTCKVTVKKAGNSFVSNAPFAAQEGSVGKSKIIYPKDWTNQVVTQQGNTTMSVMYPSAADPTQGTSNISVIVQETDSAPTYEVVKEYFTSLCTPDYFKNQLTASGMLDVTISDFKTSDYKTKNGTAFKLEYKLDYKTAVKEGTMKQVIYELYINNFRVEVTITDIGVKATPDLNQIVAYLLDTVQITK